MRSEISWMYGSSFTFRRSASKLKWRNNIIQGSAGRRLLSEVGFLKSWNVDEFRQHAFIPQIPYCLPESVNDTPPACRRWFSDVSELMTEENGGKTSTTTLNQSLWRAYSQIIVPLEITSKDPQNGDLLKFEKVEAPLDLLLRHIQDSSLQDTSIYLAQHDLRDLPKALQDDVPTPSLVKLSGKGDVYSSSLWMGKCPTYTPLHRDPNPNLFIQLAGTKVIRLFQPNLGTAIFEYVSQITNASSMAVASPATRGGISSALRGEEMMQGSERKLLHDLVWADISSMQLDSGIMAHAQQVTVCPGQALFIPKGWWHSVKGIGQGITASANWWFR